MRRRAFLVGLMTAAASHVQAQSPIKLIRIGLVSPINLRSAPQFSALANRLRELGYIDGQKLSIEFLHLDGRMERYPEAMAELVRRQVDLIIVGGQEAALKAAKEASSTIPILVVAIDYDPLVRGYFPNLARPGGNITGVVLQQIELTGKRLELLKEAVPDVARVLVFWDAISVDQFRATHGASAVLNLQLVSLELRDQPYAYEQALVGAGADGSRGDTLLVMTSPFFFRDRSLLAELALRYRLPSVLFCESTRTRAG